MKDSNKRCNFSIATHWKAILFLLVLCVGLEANARSITVTGTVVDTTDEPLIGATVQVKGSKITTVTDADGNFKLTKISDNATLIVSYIGYKTQEITVGEGKKLKITLLDDSEALDEVVVIGYGGTRARRDLTGSVGSVSGAKLAVVPVSSAAVALQGKVAGVQVSSVDGQPGADVNIRIRGTASVAVGEGSDSNPLFIVDGFQQDNIND